MLHSKLYWGLASEIQEGELISFAVQFFEQNFEGVTEVTVPLNSKAKKGYRFKIEDQK